MGFEVPDIVLNTTLQEDKYYTLRERISAMLADYHDVKASLSPIERELFSARLKDLDSCLDRGFYPLNWNSLGIGDFLSACTKAIAEFSSLVHQVQKNASIIEAAIEMISSSCLVDPNEFGSSVGVLDLQEFNEKLERKRKEQTELLLHKYRTIAPLLGKTEELVVGTNTGKCPQMASYYQHWEAKVFSAVTKMVLRAMMTLNSLLTGADEGGRGGKCQVEPLFRVSAMLVQPDIVLLSKPQGSLDVRTIPVAK